MARSVWLHLAKLNTSGLVLGTSAKSRLEELSKAYPKWQLVAHERDEFSHWMSGTGDPDHEDSRDVDIAPRKRRDLVLWLTRPAPEPRFFYKDTWRDVCRTRFFHSLGALRDLAEKNVWPAARWRDALQTWSEEGLVLRSWKYAAPLVNNMPAAVLQDIVHGVTWWMEVVAKSNICHKDILLDLCRRVLDMPLEADGSRIVRNGIETYDPVSSAINHPIGHVTQALINLWLKQNPNDNEQLPNNYRSFFSALCDQQVNHYRHGRVLLGSRLITFFRVDRPWTEQYLLPLFNWDNPRSKSGMGRFFVVSAHISTVVGGL